MFGFFEDQFRCQKGVSGTTIQSYRDSVKLFLQFISQDAGRKITRLELSDLTCDRLVKFLNHLEKTRGNAISTRNQRLAALRGLFEYIATETPEMLQEAQRVVNVPTKRTMCPRTGFLEKEQIETVLRHMPDKSQPLALCDRTLLLFLYNTGARAQEVADLRIGNLELGSKSYVHLHGKCDKWRICPLWPQTTSLLLELLPGFKDDLKAPVFLSRTGLSLTRYGIYKIVRRHVARAGIKTTSSVSPHSFRHTAAVHLLEPEVDVNFIRAWLGHVRACPKIT